MGFFYFISQIILYDNQYNCSTWISFRKENVRSVFHWCQLLTRHSTCLIVYQLELFFVSRGEAKEVNLIVDYMGQFAPPLWRLRHSKETMATHHMVQLKMMFFGCLEQEKGHGRPVFTRPQMCNDIVQF